MRLTDELDRMLLGAVGDDFVSLEFIVNKVGRPNSPVPGKSDPELLYKRLVSLIADKLINAYLLHAEPPYITPVKVSDGSLPTSWFYITQRGRKCLANSSRVLSLKSEDANARDHYSSAVNF